MSISGVSMSSPSRQSSGSVKGDVSLKATSAPTDTSVIESRHDMLIGDAEGERTTQRLSSNALQLHTRKQGDVEDMRHAPSGRSEEEHDDDGEDGSSKMFTEYYIGDTGIADSLRNIATAFEEKCRELDNLKAVRERELSETETIASLVDSLREQNSALEETLRQSQAAQTELESRLSETERDLIKLQEEGQKRDQLLYTSDRISTSLYNVLMSVKSQLEEAETLTPAIRSLASETVTSSPSESTESSSSSSTGDSSVFIDAKQRDLVAARDASEANEPKIGASKTTHVQDPDQA